MRVGVYWILDVEGRALHVYTDPDPEAIPRPTYRRHEWLSGDQRVAVILDGKAHGEISVMTLLPPLEGKSEPGVP